LHCFLQILVSLLKSALHLILVFLQFGLQALDFIASFLDFRFLIARLDLLAAFLCFRGLRGTEPQQPDAECGDGTARSPMIRPDHVLLLYSFIHNANSSAPD
jgi:hypothetical protein